MSIKVSWDNPEKTVIRQDISGYWTAEEYVDSVLEMYDTMKTVTQTVDIIVDMTQIRNFPTRMLASAPRFNTQLPPNRGLTIGINVPRHLVSIVRIALRLYPRLGRNLNFVNTVEDAYNIIERYRQRVP